MDTTVTWYKDPITGAISPGQTVAQSEALGALAVTRAQAEDALSAKLLSLEGQVLEAGTAKDLSLAYYEQALKEVQPIRSVAKPVNLILIAIAAYLFFVRF